MCSKWLRAVLGKMTSRDAISLLEQPRASSRRTSVSRAVNSAAPVPATQGAVTRSAQHCLHHVCVEPPVLYIVS